MNKRGLMGTSIDYKRVTTRGAIQPFTAVSGGTPLNILIFNGPLIVFSVIFPAGYVALTGLLKSHLEKVGFTSPVFRLSGK